MRMRNYGLLLSLFFIKTDLCHGFSSTRFFRRTQCQLFSSRDTLPDLPEGEDEDEPLSSEYNSVDLDDSELLTGPQDLDLAFASLFAQSSKQRNNIMPNSQLLMDNPNIPDLEAFVNQREGKIDENSLLLNQLKTTMVDSNDDDDDAVWLGEDEYTNFRSLLNPDGTMRRPGRGTASNPVILQPNTINPMFGPGESISDDDLSLQDLFSAIPPRPDAVDESLHEQIMREEQGFLQSSQAFSNFLGPDGGTFAKEARGDRRQKYNHEREIKQQEMLDRELKEMETSFQAAKPQSPTLACRRCGCALSPIEVVHSICSICYGEELEANSDMSYLDQIPQSYNPRGNSNDWDTSGRDDDRYRSNTGRSPGRGQSMQGMRPTQPRPSASPPIQINETMKQRNAEVLTLQQEVKTLKRQCELAEREIIRLRNLVADLQDKVDSASHESVVAESPISPWAKVIDPDSGEEFYWNEETEEMKWEM